MRNLDVPPVPAPSKDYSGSNALSALVAFVLCAAPSALIHGWALSVLWRWFVVPVTGWPRVGIWHAYGLLLTVSVARTRMSRDDDIDKSRGLGYWVAKAIVVWVGVLVAVGFGWVALQIGGQP